MFKTTLTVLAALLILSSTVLAAPRCTPALVTGSYVHQFTTAPYPYIDQLTLSFDGTAYWYQSSAFNFLLTGGTYIPQIGSWTRLADGTVLVTTIGTLYGPSGTGDIIIEDNYRRTEKFTVVDSNTLQAIKNVSTEIPLSDDPLGPGTVLDSCAAGGSTPCDPAPFKRIRPLLTDLQ